MRIPIPSFRTQIVFLVFFLVILSALFFRYFFLVSFEEYTSQVERLDVTGGVNEIYTAYGSELAPEFQDKFRRDIETVLSTEWQRNLEAALFRKEITLYSQFIFIFLVASVLVLFFVTFNLVSRPLNRLESGTVELSKGNWGIRVKESKFSPLNDLIISFNRMTGELESNRERLIEAEKEIIWREMARVMAHEVKNPLTPIRLALERIETRASEAGEGFQPVLREGASIIHEEIDNLRSLASEFSEFARLPEARKAPHDLNEQLREVIVPYEKEATFEMDLSASLPPFQADRMQMKQVFVNIIQNAIQSSGDQRSIRISTWLDNGHIGVTISDRGPGIPSDDLRRVFEPYFSRRKKGTGLGLAIVKRVVEQHEGAVRIESKEGEGTSVIMTFPNKST